MIVRKSSSKERACVEIDGRRGQRANIHVSIKKSLSSVTTVESARSQDLRRVANGRGAPTLGMWANAGRSISTCVKAMREIEWKLTALSSAVWREDMGSKSLRGRRAAVPKGERPGCLSAKSLDAGTWGATPFGDVL
jgi:hypothetical protein